MLRVNRCGLVLAAFLAGTAATALSQTVFQLKNGDRVTGKVLSEDANRVVISNSWGSEVTVPLSQIGKREDAPLLATGTNATTASVSTNAPKDWGTNAAAALGTKPGVGARPSMVKLPTWAFDLQLGASLQYNQRSYQNVSGLFQANYTNKLTRDIFEYSAAYGRTEGVVSANRMDGNNRTEYDFDKSRRTYVFNAVDAGYDRVRKIDFTWDDTVGIGYKLIQKTNFVLNASFGVNYQEQFFSDEGTKDYFSLNAGESATWSINRHVSLNEKFDVYPRMSDLGKYRFRAESNVNVKLNDPGTIYLVFSVIDQYDSRPAEDVTRNDLQLISRIGMKF